NDVSVDSANVATVSVTVTAVNDAPVAVDFSATTDDGMRASSVTRVQACALPIDALHATTLSTPAHGTASVIATGPDAGKVLYTPDRKSVVQGKSADNANHGTID